MIDFNRQNVELGCFTWGRPFIVSRRSTGIKTTYPANAAWVELKDGALQVAGTVEQEDEDLTVSYTDRPIRMISGSLTFIGDIYAPGDWSFEYVPSE